MDPTPDLERLQDALEELLAVTTEGRAADLLRALIGAIILEGSDTALTALVEMATYVAPDGMATVVVARDMAPRGLLEVAPVEVGHGETPPDGYEATRIHLMTFNGAPPTARLEWSPPSFEEVLPVIAALTTPPATFSFQVQDHTGAAVTCSAEGCTRQATQFSYHNGTQGWCAEHSPFQFKYSAHLG